MKIRYLIRRIPKEANWLAASAAAILLTKFLYLDRIPELFQGASKAGGLVESLLTSLLAGYVFYFFVQQITEARQFIALSPFVQSQVKWINGITELQVREISEASGILMDLATLDRDQIVEAFGKLSPNSSAPLYMVAANREAIWIEYFEFYREKTSYVISTLRYQQNYLTPEISAAIADIDNSNFFHFLRNISSTHSRTISNENMLVLAEIFYLYASRCRDLSSHAAKYAEEF
ncbi:MAG: hypothetical protein H7Z73_00180, partial [Candidatus Saccharibacteria bacterium]|nr:hypothetical protein [Moraxellaceae bacterium]